MCGSCYIVKQISAGRILFFLKTFFLGIFRPAWKCIKKTKSATMNIFRFFFYFLFKLFVKVELSYAFTINMFTIAGNCTKK